MNAPHEARRVRDPGWTAPRPGGECVSCGRRIEVGDLVQHAIGDGYEHVRCPR